jgi:predicted nucleic acid-binding protein
VIAYIDTSALLRIVVREPAELDELLTYERLVSSELIAVESARTIDRLRLQGALTLEEAAQRTAAVTEWLEAIDLVLLRPPVLTRASEPMPMPIGTLGAIHLATALIWRDRMGPLPERRTTPRLAQPRAPLASRFAAPEPPATTGSHVEGDGLHTPPRPRSRIFGMPAAPGHRRVHGLQSPLMSSRVVASSSPRLGAD